MTVTRRFATQSYRKRSLFFLGLLLTEPRSTVLGSQESPARASFKSFPFLDYSCLSLTLTLDCESRLAPYVDCTPKLCHLSLWHGIETCFDLSSRHNLKVLMVKTQDKTHTQQTDRQTETGGGAWADRPGKESRKTIPKRGV